MSKKKTEEKIYRLLEEYSNLTSLLQAQMSAIIMESEGAEQYVNVSETQAAEIIENLAGREET